MAHVILILIALVMDVGSWGGGHRHYRSRQA
jgi:hypothetical protein